MEHKKLFLPRAVAIPWGLVLLGVSYYSFHRFMQYNTEWPLFTLFSVFAFLWLGGSHLFGVRPLVRPWLVDAIGLAVAVIQWHMLR